MVSIVKIFTRCKAFYTVQSWFVKGFVQCRNKRKYYSRVIWACALSVGNIGLMSRTTSVSLSRESQKHRLMTCLRINVPVCSLIGVPADELTCSILGQYLNMYCSGVNLVTNVVHSCIVLSLLVRQLNASLITHWFHSADNIRHALSLLFVLSCDLF